MLGLFKGYRPAFIGLLVLFALVGTTLPSAQEIVASQVLRKVTGENIKLPRTGDWHSRFKESEMPRMQKITEKVYLFQAPHSFPGLATNNLVVITSDGVVVLDGQGNEQTVRRMLDEIKKLTPLPVRYVVIGSAHGDHTGGNKGFPPGVIFVSHALLKTWYEMDARTLKENPKAWVYNKRPEGLVMPTEFVGTVPADPRRPAPAATKVLKVGDTELHISYPGYRGHSGPDLQTYLPRERILWMAESFTAREFPSMGSSAYPSEWAALLKQAESRFGKDVDNVLGAHGPMDSPAINKEEFGNFRRAIEAVNAEAKRLYQAKIPLDDVPQHWNFGPYLSSLFLSEYAFPDMWKNYLELSGKLPPCPPCSPDPGEMNNHVGPEPGWEWPPKTP